MNINELLNQKVVGKPIKAHEVEKLVKDIKKFAADEDFLKNQLPWQLWAEANHPMIEITFEDFYAGDWENVKAYFQMYIVYDDENEPLYVGISESSVWNRWFGTRSPHIVVREDGVFGTYNSAIGEYIVDNIPKSWKWKVQLHTLGSSLGMLPETCEVIKWNIKALSIKLTEPFVIQMLNPKFNVTYNG